ncbi:type I-E CRISPR-associated endonuclease Cas1e [Actinokineospora cianjurensis]|uniref:CRISPR-associated endonuclease Cas1 n=1 Tax=Actinokineospora cianjurensis TaxID=585224 RepID=A0A421B335_9PSEU|nr:type I-E CRISPR-associated endonuclease Cas1e [Actinokineospora cianjurensis]RLK58703.1 CRISPR-associated Cas1 family protein [Actinokineospora cianjurensis]
MKEIPGARPVPISQLSRAQDRLTFLYLEHCVVHRDANAITARDARGTVHIPAATLGALLLGPGTNVSQQAMVLLAESGSTAVWVGEHGVRYYAHGRTLTRSSRLLERQAELVSNRSERLRVARAMYAIRFPDEDTSGLTMQQLRGREGARVRAIYRAHAKRTGVQWERRDYDAADFDSGTPINQALSAANTSLYGVVHAVTVALGCAPGLGFVHTGHTRSFVFDIADLYKTEITIPIAFDITAREVGDIGSETRRAVRDRMKDGKFLETCVRDIKALLTAKEDDTIEYGPEAFDDPDIVMLWDNNGRNVASGVAYDEDDL